MLITYQGKRVIVAGAARGIGHAIAVSFAENGAERDSPATVLRR